MALLFPYPYRLSDHSGGYASAESEPRGRGETLPIPPLAARLRLPVAVVLGLVLCCVCAAAVADDAYLQLLDAEASKVEPEATDTEVSDAAGGSESTVREMSALASREQFETMLRQENVGTYSFYRKLPERSREEIFVDYRNGASMEALRGKVVNRYLNP